MVDYTKDEIVALAGSTYGDLEIIHSLKEKFYGRVIKRTVLNPNTANNWRDKPKEYSTIPLFDRIEFEKRDKRFGKRELLL